VLRAVELGLPMLLGILGGTAEHWAQYGTAYRQAWTELGHPAETADIAVAVHGFVAEVGRADELTVGGAGSVDCQVAAVEGVLAVDNVLLEVRETSLQDVDVGAAPIPASRAPGLVAERLGEQALSLGVLLQAFAAPAAQPLPDPPAPRQMYRAMLRFKPISARRRPGFAARLQHPQQTPLS
jgi:hypothetical protein